MSIRVAIMGFGRIGRNIFRTIYPRDDITLVAINDIAPPEALEYLLRFDTLQGRFSDPVRIIDNTLYAKGRGIPVLQHKEPGEIPWYDYGVDVVIEATGRYRTREELQKHLDKGADRVILSVPPRDAIDLVYIRGITPDPIDRSARILSAGSSTGNCCASMVKVLDEAFGIESGCFTSIHAYTTEQNLIDAPSPIDLRLSRAAIENIVPVQSWTGHLVTQLFPKLEGRFTGHKLNVPVPDVSCVDLVSTLSRDVTISEVNEVFRSAAGSTQRGVVAYQSEPIVSSDVVGCSESCVYDSLATMIVGDNMIKTLGWYDQGGGLAHRIVDLLDAFAPKRGATSIGKATS